MDSFVSIVLLFLSFLTRSLLVSFRSVPLRFPICFVLFCSVPFLSETRRNATFFSWFVFLVWKFVKPSPPPNTKTQNAKPPHTTQRNATQHIHRRRKARPRLLQVRDGRRWVRHPLRDLPKGLRHRLRGIEGHQRPIADLSRLDPPRHQGLGRPRSRIRPRGNLSRGAFLVACAISGVCDPCVCLVPRRGRRILVPDRFVPDRIGPGFCFRAVAAILFDSNLVVCKRPWSTDPVVLSVPGLCVRRARCSPKFRFRPRVVLSQHPFLSKNGCFDDSFAFREKKKKNPCI